MSKETDRRKAEVQRVQDLRRSSASAKHRDRSKYDRKRDVKHAARRYE